MRPSDASSRFAIERRGSTPIYRQLADRLREAIATGSLAPGSRLPSARSLASQIGTARGTVDAAYAMLAGEGAIVTQGPAGTIVAPHLTGAQVPRTPPTLPPARDDAEIWHEHPRPFRMGLPALDAFPRKLWSTLTARQARTLAAGELSYPDPFGHRPLREAIATYLGIARGIGCSADQVLITGGFQGALALIASALLHRGDVVWVEDPGYFLARQSLEMAGARLAPVPVDRDGMRVESAVTTASAARFALVTPTHQSPLGVSLSLPRRLALLAWAAKADAWVIEDDYDSEFRYTGHPLPALKSLDRAGRVLYAGTFSKVLFPGLRLGYLVVPDSLGEAFDQAVRLLQSGQSVFGQKLVTAFMTEGHFARHIRRMRSLYAARRRALTNALSDIFADRVSLELQAGGMHLLARFPGAPHDTELVRRAELAGLAPTALSSLFLTNELDQGLLLSFTNIPEAEAHSTVGRLCDALR